MKDNFLKMIVLALIIMNILDGDFARPGLLDMIKMVLLAICLILTFIPSKKED